MKYVIIGLGAAGTTAAEELRRRDANAEITVFNGEGIPFYLRLDLEALFFGKPIEQLMPRPESFWGDRRIEIIPQRAVKVDSSSHAVTAADGSEISYDKLLIACGAHPVLLDWPGKELAGIHVYRTLEDAKAILDNRNSVKRAVMIGGGILGMELAYVATHLGWQATLIVRGSHVGSPMLDADGGAFVLSRMRSQNVDVIFGDEVAAFDGRNGALTAVHTKNGRVLEADFAAVCIGVKPDLTFLPTSFVTQGKVAVTEQMRTVDESIFAVGDAAIVRDHNSKLITSHTWRVATAQALIAAANMTGANDIWRESVIYDLDTFFDREFAMIGAWEERAAEGNVMHDLSSADVFRKLVTREGKLVAALLVGDRTGDRRIRKLIADGTEVDGKLERIFATA